MSESIRIRIAYPIDENRTVVAVDSYIVSREVADRIISRSDAPGVKEYSSQFGERIVINYDIDGLEIKEIVWP
jgi:hypothetical protein